MAIEKYIENTWKVEEFLDSPVKIANWNPETFIPPDIEQYILQLTPDPRFSYVHLIAMSDGDWYGSNMNGDVFDQDQLLGVQTSQEAMKNPPPVQGDCLPRFKTFEQAKFYRHHDNRPTSTYYGDVPCAAWNEPMRRVELIIRIAREDIPELGMKGAPDIIIKLDKRGFIVVSMGCRIEHEQCSYCKATNQFIKDRCHHLARQMGQIMPNGVKVSARNFGMRFFDLSDVSIPADPIAYSLQKVASDQKVARGVRRVRREWDVPPTSKAAWVRKRSSIYKEVPGSMGETIPRQDAVSTAAYADGTPVPLVPFKGAQLEALKAAGTLNEIVSTATLCGVVFSPQELAQLSITKSATVEGFDDLSLDSFSPRVYDALRDTLSTRSGYAVATPIASWEPEKIAQQGYPEVAEYYDYYRESIRAIPRTSFIKAARTLGPLCSLHEGDMTKIASAMHALVYTGL